MMHPTEQLDDTEIGAFHASIAKVRAATAGHLLQGLDQRNDGAAAVDFIVHLHRGLDTVAARAAATGPAPACQPGCSHCCHLRVEATQPEVLLIARALRQRPATVQAEWVDRLRQHGAAARQAGTPLRQPCAFLVDNRCAIYTLRPGTCRKAHSLSAERCAAQAESIPQNLALLVDAEALLVGTAAGYRDAGLEATAQELNAAVLTALGDDAAEDRWFGARRRS